VGTILKNQTSTPKCYVLHAGPQAAQHVADQLPVVRIPVPIEKHDPSTGSREIKTQNLRVPTSISLMPKGLEGDKSKPLPDAVRHIREIQIDQQAGHITFEDVADAEAPTASPAPPVAPILADPPALPDDPTPARSRRGDK
jgi:hypothetical protein